MSKKHLRAGTISMGSFVLTQSIRFGGNIFLTKLLAPEAFGLASIVNMTILGLTLMSDLGLRLVVVQREGKLDSTLLNTVWTVQVIRGFGIWLVALLAALGIFVMQAQGKVAGNVYADPLLPYLIACAATSALCSGFESTNDFTAHREMALGRVLGLGLFSQLVAMVVMLSIARATGSPWALVVGSVVSSVVHCLGGHLVLPGIRNRFHWNKEVVREIMHKSKWILVSTPVTFMQSSADVMILGSLVNTTQLGGYSIAFMLANVVQMVAGNLAGNVFFPGMSAAGRESPEALRKTYLRFQLVSDAIIVTIAAGLIAAGPSIVGWLFDKRYGHSGEILSILAIGLVGLRYHVIEAMLQAQGNFKLSSIVGFVRLLTLIAGIYTGFAINGLMGAALGVALSWFAGWPIHLWYRAKTIAWPWKVEAAAVCFLALGYGLGLLFAKLVTYLPCLHC